MILYYMNKLKLKKIKILELGFGGGQLAYKVIKKGNTYYGIDIYKKRRLADLLINLSNVNEIEWIRIQF